MAGLSAQAFVYGQSGRRAVYAGYPPTIPEYGYSSVFTPAGIMIRCRKCIASRSGGRKTLKVKYKSNDYKSKTEYSDSKCSYADL